MLKNIEGQFFIYNWKGHNKQRCPMANPGKTVTPPFAIDSEFFYSTVANPSTI